MKIILWITLLLSMNNISGQENSNLIKSSIGFGFSSNNLRTNVFEVEYQRKTILGINIIAGYITSNGGISLDNLVEESDYQNTLESLGMSQFQSTGNKAQGTFYNLEAFKAGFQKNINLAKNTTMGISISALRANISETAIDNFIYNEDNSLQVEELVTKFATYSSFGSEVGIHLHHNISSYILAGLSVKYISLNEFIIPGFLIAVNF
jgi:hypothetical protein